MMPRMLTALCLMYAFLPGSEAKPKPTVLPNYTALATCLKLSNASTATATKILAYMSLNQYIIIQPSPPLNANSRTRRPATTSVSSKGCPFTWRTDFDSSRRPPILLKAVCPSSNAICSKCRAVTYGHQVLKFKCNALWDWETVNLPVAFVRV